VQNGSGAFDGFTVIRVLEGASDVKLELARLDVRLVFGDSEDIGSLGVGSESTSDRPSVLEKGQGDMRGELMVVKASP
jgi:hypothetical protein